LHAFDGEIEQEKRIRQYWANRAVECIYPFDARIEGFIQRTAFSDIGLHVNFFQALVVALLLLLHLHTQNGQLVFSILIITQEFENIRKCRA
jgi:hypothetical protein